MRIVSVVIGALMLAGCLTFPVASSATEPIATDIMAPFDIAVPDFLGFPVADASEILDVDLAEIVFNFEPGMTFEPAATVLPSGHPTPHAVRRHDPGWLSS